MAKKILCEKYLPHFTTGEKYINIFNNNVAWELITTVDLYDYAVKDSIGEIKYTFENVTDNNELYFESSTFSFQVSNGKEYEDNKRIKDFLEFFNFESYHKYIIKVYDESNTDIWYGIIHKDGIKIENVEQQIFSITAQSYGREFKEYYQSKDLLGSGQVFFQNKLGITGFNSLELQNFLQRILSLNVFWTLDIEEDIKRWFVAERPYYYLFANNFVNQVLFIQSGYTCFDQSSVSTYDYFNGLIKSMGWIWFFYKNKLVIRKRSTIDNSEMVTLNYNDCFIKHGISTEYLTENIKNVVINNGVIKVGSDARRTVSNEYSDGETYLNYSKNLKYNNNKLVVPFYHYDGDIGSRANYFITEDYLNYEYSRYKGNDNGQYKFKAIKIEDHTRFDRLVVREYNYFEDETLHINVITNKDKFGVIDINNARGNGADVVNGNTIKDSSHTLSNGDVYFSGNPGGCLYRFSPEFGNQGISYDTYTRSIEFFDNIKTLFSSDHHEIFDVDLETIHHNPLTSFQIQDYPYTNLDNKVFKLKELSFNIFRNNTKMKLKLAIS